MAARSTSGGVITFGLVTVPVRIFPGTSSQRVSFSMLHAKDKGRVRQKLTCSTCGQTIERSETTRGYERAPDQFVVVTDQELKALQKKSEHAIDVQEFVPLEAVDPIYFEKSNLLGPDKGGHRPYLLLAEAMKRAGKVALARFSTRGQEQLVLLRPFERGLIMHTLYYADEIRSMADVPMDREKVPREQEINLALQLIDQLSSETFEPEKYRDEYRDALLAMLEGKASKESVVHAPKFGQKSSENIVDIVDVLKASLAGKKRGEVVREAPSTSPRPARVAAHRRKR